MPTNLFIKLFFIKFYLKIKKLNFNYFCFLNYCLLIFKSFSKIESVRLFCRISLGIVEPNNLSMGADEDSVGLQRMNASLTSSFD